MIFRAKNGAEIIEKIQIDEFEAMKKYISINHVLAIIKIEGDYLMGWHKWRNDWETFGGLIEDGECLRECIYRECEEELGIKNINFEYLGIICHPDIGLKSGMRNMVDFMVLRFQEKHWLR